MMGGWGEAGSGSRSVGPCFSRAPEWWEQREVEGASAEAEKLGVEGG